MDDDFRIKDYSLWPDPDSGALLTAIERVGIVQDKRSEMSGRIRGDTVNDDPCREYVIWGGCIGVR